MTSSYVSSSGFLKNANHRVSLNYDVYICDKKGKKKRHTDPYCCCFVSLLRGITWSPVQLRVNQTFVKCNKFQRGNNLFSYYRKNREYICKRSLRTLSFLNRKYFTKGATKILDRYFFLFYFPLFTVSVTMLCTDEVQRLNSCILQVSHLEHLNMFGAISCWGDLKNILLLLSECYGKPLLFTSSLNKVRLKIIRTFSLPLRFAVTAPTSPVRFLSARWFQYCWYKKKKIKKKT